MLNAVPSRNRLATGNPTSRVVVGLGNAERQYARTRHNVGARAVAEAAARLGVRVSEGLVPIPLSRSGLVLPAGFMNDSGGVVLKAVERWRPTAHGLLIVHDELDLGLGEVRWPLSSTPICCDCRSRLPNECETRRQEKLPPAVAASSRTSTQCGATKPLEGFLRIRQSLAAYYGACRECQTPRPARGTTAHPRSVHGRFNEAARMCCDGAWQASRS